MRMLAIFFRRIRLLKWSREELTARGEAVAQRVTELKGVNLFFRQRYGRLKAVYLLLLCMGGTLAYIRSEVKPTCTIKSRY